MARRARLTGDAHGVTRKPIHVFSVQVIVLTLLIFWWPTPKQLYPDFFHAQANLLFSWGPRHTLRFEAKPADDPRPVDTVMTGYARGRPDPLWTAWFSVNRMGYWPVSTLTAMLLATPMAARRRLGALAAGLFLLNLYTLARVMVTAQFAFYEQAHGPGGPAQSLLHLLLKVGSEGLTSTMQSLAGILIAWALVAQPGRSIDLGPVRRLIGMER